MWVDMNMGMRGRTCEVCGRRSRVCVWCFLRVNVWLSGSGWRFGERVTLPAAPTCAHQQALSDVHPLPPVHCPPEGPQAFFRTDFKDFLLLKGLLSLPALCVCPHHATLPGNRPSWVSACSEWQVSPGEDRLFISPFQFLASVWHRQSLCNVS